MEKRKPEVTVLPPLTGKIVLNETLERVPDKPWEIKRGEWTAKDGALWAAQKDGDAQPAWIQAPLAVQDAVLQYELCFRGANRHSLRVESSDHKHSFRIVVSRTYVEITKNPAQGESTDQTEPLARKTLKLETGEWYPLRITFHGTDATAEIAGVKATGTHAVIGEPKGVANFLVFDKSIGFRKVQVAVDEPQASR